MYDLIETKNYHSSTAPIVSFSMIESRSLNRLAKKRGAFSILAPVYASMICLVRGYF
jgi:hypothetical protein